MRYSSLLVALSCALALLPGAVTAKTSPAAASQVYECHFVGGEVDWIKDKLFIVRDLKTNEIKVLDPIINRVFKKPIPAKVVLDSASRLEIDWTMANLPGTRGSTTVDYHMIFLKAQSTVSEKAVVRGFDNKESRSGTCALQAN